MGKKKKRQRLTSRGKNRNDPINPETNCKVWRNKERTTLSLTAIKNSNKWKCSLLHITLYDQPLTVRVYDGVFGGRTIRCSSAGRRWCVCPGWRRTCMHLSNCRWETRWWPAAYCVPRLWLLQVSNAKAFWHEEYHNKVCCFGLTEGTIRVICSRAGRRQMAGDKAKSIKHIHSDYDEWQWRRAITVLKQTHTDIIYTYTRESD